MAVFYCLFLFLKLCSSLKLCTIIHNIKRLKSLKNNMRINYEYMQYTYICAIIYASLCPVSIIVITINDSCHSDENNM